MKKKATALLLVIATALTLTACGKFTCGLCGEEKSGKSYKTEVLGEKITICEDCHDDIQELRDALK